MVYDVNNTQRSDKKKEMKSNERILEKRDMKQGAWRKESFTANVKHKASEQGERFRRLA